MGVSRNVFYGHSLSLPDSRKAVVSFCVRMCTVLVNRLCIIEEKAMIRNRYNYLTPPITDIKGKETQTRNN